MYKEKEKNSTTEIRGLKEETLLQLFFAGATQRAKKVNEETASEKVVTWFVGHGKSTEAVYDFGPEGNAQNTAAHSPNKTSTRVMDMERRPPYMGPVRTQDEAWPVINSDNPTHVKAPQTRKVKKGRAPLTSG